MKKALLVLMILFGYLTMADAKDRPEWKFGISGQLLGPTVFGIYSEYQIKPKLNMVLAVGANFNFQTGMTFTLVAEKPRVYWYPYIGLQIVSIKIGEMPSNYQNNRALGVIFPLGLKFITKDNWTFAFELAYNIIKTEADQLNTRPWLPAIRVGKYF